MASRRDEGVHRLIRERSPGLVDDAKTALRYHLYLDLLEYLAEHRPGGCASEIRLVGNDNVVKGLAWGNGVVLWVAPFAHSDLITKRGLAEAGHRVSHLSQYSHGFQTNTWFGRRVLNPIKTKIEERYLLERCVILPEGAGPAVRQLISRLRGNGIVSINAINTGRRVFECPFLGGVLRLANGAPSIARSTGASLLPVFTTPDSEGGYTIAVLPALLSNATDPAAAEQELALRFAALMEPIVREHPAIWRGWFGSTDLWRAHRNQ